MGVLRVGAVIATTVVLTACTSSSPDPEPTPSTSPTPTKTPSDTPEPPREFEVPRVLDDIRHLAREIGPRHGTSDAYQQAADWVAERFIDLGYDVVRQEVNVPSGNSWGIDVPAGRTPNIIASPAGFDDEVPHRIVGAHLDTVPQAPGAEDNASGVAVMLELARLHVSDDRPVRFIAFTSEEPRGPGDNMHHFGSQAYVKRLSASEREAMRAMVSLDRVGVRARAVPLCIGGSGTKRVRGQLVRSARDADIPTTTCADNRASDHWSFERSDLPSARVGSVPYAAYHSARDLPRVVDRRQLQRVGATMTAWLDVPGS